MVDSSNMPPIERARMGQPEPPDPVFVSLQRPALPLTDEVAFWELIYKTSDALSFDKFEQHIKEVCDGSMRAVAIRNLPFSRVEAYELLKTATDQFLIKECGILSPTSSGEWQDLADRAALQLGTPIDGTDLEKAWNSYVGENPRDEENIAGVIPYFDLLRNKFKDVKVQDRDDKHKQLCSIILSERLKRPCMIELIWSYWMEEAMLVQVLNAIALRFQNRRGPGDRKLFANLEIDPLRPLNNLLWGYIQDEQHRLTVLRRHGEYHHHYGLQLEGRAVQRFRPADTRSTFIEAFHRLLRLCTEFYKQDDQTTVKADAFGVLNALKEVHLILSQGAHSQFGDLPPTARIEMLMQQWLLSRPEFREFLPTRVMVAYPEPWMDRVDAMKKVQGWHETSVMHFHTLAVMGEQILLSIRYGAWSTVFEPTQAFNFARFWRPQVQGYIHAYRAATGVELGAEIVDSRVDATLPSVLLQRRLAAQHRSL
jgi:hypothetical protein